MIVTINNPVQQTIIFSILALCALIFSLRKKSDGPGLSMEVTNELKGFAMVGIVLSHISYFLVSDNRFLFPWSIFAGVGVDMFLFLSGYGLTVSALKQPLSIGQFYLKRATKVLIPFWLTLIALLAIDYLLLHQIHPLKEMVQAIFGFFPVANLYYNINSPFWYITFILFYYAIFPVFIRPKQLPPVVSAVLIFVLTQFLLKLALPVDGGVLYLYQVHALAFPLGVLAVYAFYLPCSLKQNLKDFFQLKSKLLVNALRMMALLALLGLVYYVSFHSGVGKGLWKEQLISNLIAITLIGIALLKRFKINLLSLIGVYSYEIYLWHWPLVYRYDFLYRFLPPAIATIIYFAVFIAVGFGLKKLVQLVPSSKNTAPKRVV